MLNLKHALSLSLMAVLVASSASAATVALTANLTNGAETGPNTPATLGPPTTSTGDPRPVSFGVANFILDTTTPSMTMTVSVFNIDVDGTQTPDVNDNLVAAHIHAGLTPNANGGFGVVWGFFGNPFNNTIAPGVLTPFANGVGGTLTTTWDAPEGNNTTLSAQVANILAGRSYINFHTVQFTGGEVRGALEPVPEPATIALVAGAIGLLAIARRFRTA